MKVYLIIQNAFYKNVESKRFDILFIRRKEAIHIMVIKWTNLSSNESGYVRSIDYKNRHFNNTFDINEAKTFTQDTAEKTVNKLIEYGEGKSNKFEILEG